MSLHKDAVCGLIACTVALAVNFFGEHQFVLAYMSEQDCADRGSHCTAEDGAQNCWCTVNMISHIPTFLAVVSAAVFGIASGMRAVVSSIFEIWLQPK